VVELHEAIMRDHVFISDLDGTLLRRDAMLSVEAKAVLERVLEAGVAFTVASARSVSSMRTALRGLVLRLRVIEFNGAFISEPDTGRHLVTNALDGEVAATTYDLMSAAVGAPLVSAFDGAADRVYFDRPRNQGMAAYLDARHAWRDPRMSPVADPRRHLGEQVVCLTCIARREPLAELLPELARRFEGRVGLHLFEDGYNPGWHWLTVHDRRANKEQAVRTLLELAGLAGRPVTAFGDQLNDLALFRAARRAIAVEGAAQELRDRAHEVIGSAEEDAVAHYIARAAGLPGYGG
jgi:5-amino-6-(5-phospho-D-ribitylamino)uracil phosphatase